MNIQGPVVLAIAAAAVLYFGRKLVQNLARKGRDAGCGCGDSGCCKGKPKARARIGA